MLLENLDLQAARRLFRDAPTVHVGSILPDGRPHVVPLWFVWPEEGIYVSCRSGSQVHRNLQRQPDVALEFDRGRSWSELAGALISGIAQLLPPDHPSLKRGVSAWFDKYRSELGGTQFGSYAEQVPEPAFFLVTPRRVAGWAHDPVFA